MTTATITRIYHLELDGPMWDEIESTPQERLHAWLEMARMCPEEAFKCLVEDDIDGRIE